MSVFVYGSLLAPEVLQVLLGRTPKATRATLAGYRRYAIKGRPYPAIVSEKGHTVEGQVLHQLSAKEKGIFDAFEDTEYLCTPVEVKTVESGELVEADAYVFVTRIPELQGEWDYEHFRQVHLEEYVKMCAGFMEELEG